MRPGGACRETGKGKFQMLEFKAKVYGLAVLKNGVEVGLIESRQRGGFSYASYSNPNKRYFTKVFDTKAAAIQFASDEHGSHENV